MKELRFDTERPRDEDRDQIELPINGEIYFAYRPSTNAIALFYASAGKNNTAVALAGVLEFLEKVLEAEAYALIMRAVTNDALDFSEIVGLSREVIREFGENPPSSSAASSRSRASTGTSSTGTSRRPAPTRRASVPPVSVA